MPTVITRTSYLEVNSVPLSTPGWHITNLAPGMRGFNLKGGDTDVAHATGGLGNRRRKGIAVKTFQLFIRSDYNKDGALQSPWQTGFETNVDYLEANLGIASATPVPAVYHRYDGSTKAADVIISTWEVGEFDRTKKHGIAVLELTVPAGEFT